MRAAGVGDQECLGLAGQKPENKEDPLFTIAKGNFNSERTIRSSESGAGERHKESRGRHQAVVMAVGPMEIRREKENAFSFFSFERQRLRIAFRKASCVRQWC